MPAPKYLDHCWFCGEEYETGITISLTVATNGKGRRIQKHAVLARICQKCGNAPTGRRARPKLVKGLRDALGACIAHIELQRDVQQGTKVCKVIT